MQSYNVRETITVVHHVEAHSPEEAIELAKQRGPLDADEIDCSERGARSDLTAELAD